MFESGQVTVDGREYSYRLLVPLEDQQGPHPLVVFLHGIGERGSDNERQLVYLPEVMASEPNRKQRPCYLLAMQCPPDQKWVEVPHGAKTSTPMTQQATQPMRALVQAIGKTVDECPIDPARIYLTGLSMGGYGAFDLGCRHPEWFAALLPVCGGGDEHQAHRLARLPTWVWHGDQDRAVPVERSRQMVEAIGTAEGVVTYRELPGVGHDSWHNAYGNDGALDWLFAQRATAPAALQKSEPARVRYHLFAPPEEGWAELPDLDPATAIASGTLPNMRGHPGPGPMGVALTSTLSVPRSGDYAFRLETCDGPARLFLDDKLVCAQDQPDRWHATEANVALKAGDATLRLVYVQQTHPTLCRVLYKPPGGDDFVLVDAALRLP